MNNIKKYLDSLREFTFPGTRALARELDAVREAHTAAGVELEKAREELRHTRETDAQQLADLRDRLRRNEAERTTAQSRVGMLEEALADAEQRRQTTEARVSLLETKLEEEHSRTEASLHTTENALRRLQDAQQSLLMTQSGLADRFEHSAASLLETLESERKKPLLSTLHLMIVTGVLFVTGILFGAYAVHRLQEESPELAVMQMDIHAMRTDIKQHLDNQDELLKGLAQALNRLAFGEKVRFEGVPGDSGKPVPGAAAGRPETEPPVPDIGTLRADLESLGFAVGSSAPNGTLDAPTRETLREFRQLYLPKDDAHTQPVSAALVSLASKAAGLVRADAGRYRVDHEVLGAIRLASLRTGVDFSFLMDLARVESNYDPEARATSSSAAGLYQFNAKSWLEAVRSYGDHYGLQEYTALLQPADDARSRAELSGAQRKEILALRLNPRLSALLAAENVRRNRKNLSRRTSRTPGRTDLYLSHFFGTNGAVKFLETLDAEPAAIAGDLFPEAAASNTVVFRDSESQPRTVAEVYRWFESRFNNARHARPDPG